MRRPAIALWLSILGVMLAGAASAQARIVFPDPGTMRITDLPAVVPPGKVLTLREVSPVAVFSGGLRLERQDASGDWHSVAYAPLRPWVVWLHWKVPANAAGSTLALRFVLEAQGHELATSAAYTPAVPGKGGPGA